MSASLLGLRVAVHQFVDVMVLHGLPAVEGHVPLGHFLPQKVAFELVLARGDVADDGGIIFRSVRDSPLMVNGKRVNNNKANNYAVKGRT